MVQMNLVLSRQEAHATYILNYNKCGVMPYVLKSQGTAGKRSVSVQPNGSAGFSYRTTLCSYKEFFHF